MDSPVTVSITFATLEIAITALAKLRSENKAADVVVKAEAPKADAPAPAAKAPTKAEKAAAAKAAEKSADSSPTADTAPTAAAADKPTTSATVDYSVVSGAITQAVTKDRASVIALLAKYGAKSGKDLKPEQYAAFLGDLAVPAEEALT